MLNDNGVTASAGLAPTDEALSQDSKYLYVINSGDDTLGAYTVNAQTGALTMIGKVGDLHPTSAGLAAR